MLRNRAPGSPRRSASVSASPPFGFRTLASLVLLVFGGAVSAFADSHDQRLESTRWSVFIHTHADDELRRNRIWIVALGEQLYVRTGSTRWHDDILLDPRVTIEFGDRRRAFRVSLVLDPREHAHVMRAFRAKYGWMDWLVHRMRDTTFRLVPVASKTHPDETDASRANPLESTR